MTKLINKLTAPKKSHTSFWADEFEIDFDSNVYKSALSTSQVESLKKYRLSSARKAISNFVTIATGKAIPVRFSTGKDSYTDGDTVVLSGDVDDKENFDIGVGLALHEGSHILLTDFTLLRSFTFIEKRATQIPTVLYDKAVAKGVSDTKTLGIVKDLLNVVEDRRIDQYIYKNAPGYREYYKKLYEKYFGAKVITDALASSHWRSETVNSYMGRITNFMNPNSELTALRGLKKIWNKLDVHNISRLKNTTDAFHTALDIFEIIIDSIDGPVPQPKQPKQPKQKPQKNKQSGQSQKDEQGEKSDELGNKGTSDEESDEDSDESSEESENESTPSKKSSKKKDEDEEENDGESDGVNDGESDGVNEDESEDESNGDSDEDESDDESDEQSEEEKQADYDADEDKAESENDTDSDTDSDTENDTDESDDDNESEDESADGEETDSNELDEEIDADYDAEGEETYEELSKNKQNILDKILRAQRKFLSGELKKEKITEQLSNEIQKIEDAGAELAHVADNFHTLGKGVDVVVYKSLTIDMVEKRTIPLGKTFSYANRKHPSAELYACLSDEELAQAEQMGTMLGKKLQVRGESRTTVYNRQRNGRIDSRMIASLGFDNESVFNQKFIDQYKKANIHLSLDASSSMSGQKWVKTIINAMALGKAVSMIENLSMQISVRYSHDLPEIVIVWDSKKDSYAKLKTLLPYLHPNGCTPEGLCFEAINKLMVPSNANMDSYFVNISDGEPYFSTRGTAFSYHGSVAEDHTKREIEKIRNSGIGVLSYFIGDGETTNEAFTKMYGKSARFININSIIEVSNTMNKLFMTK